MQILTQPKNALVKQYQKLLEYDDVELVFQPEALEAVAEKAIEGQIRSAPVTCGPSWRGHDPHHVRRSLRTTPSKGHHHPEASRSGAAPVILRGSAAAPERAGRRR